MTSDAEPARSRAGYLGPPGTFSDEALVASVDGAGVEPVAMATIHDAVMAVQAGEVRWSLVPIENSIEGPVTVTLDALTGEASDVRIVGEVVLAVRQCLIARAPLELASITTVVSHPQATGQCAGFLRERLPGARVLSASSTADAVRVVAESAQDTWAALGPRLAASIYGCAVLCEDVQDGDDNETRFVWLARDGDDRPPLRPNEAPFKTSLVFWGPGTERPGWLVACLSEFSRRAVNLTKIESRPRRDRLGRYMIFIDCDGAIDDEPVAAAVAGLREHAQVVRLLGSYQAAR